MISSAHDVGQIEVFYLKWMNSYGKLFDATLNFRLIVSDYAWATMISTINLLNRMTQAQYAQTVFDYAKGLNFYYLTHMI